MKGYGGSPTAASGTCSISSAEELIQWTGLSFNPEACMVFHEEIVRVIWRVWLNQVPEELPYAISDWGRA